MWKTFARALRHCQGDWVILFENDAEFDPTVWPRLKDLTMDKPHLRVVWLDERNGVHDGPSRCCTVAVAFHRGILPQMMLDFAYTLEGLKRARELRQSLPGGANEQPYWADYASKTKALTQDEACLTDWYLGNLIAFRGIPGYSLGIVHHPTAWHNSKRVDDDTMNPSHVTRQNKKASRTQPQGWRL